MSTIKTKAVSAPINGTTVEPLALQTNNLDRITVDSSGNVGIGTGSPSVKLDVNGGVRVTSAEGLGYGTGSGGTVTQATSKSTAVALNRPTGQITMNNAALAAGARVSFVLNNSQASSTDVVIANVSGGTANPDEYLLRARVASGAVAITVINQGSVSLSEAIVINFALIKGAAS